MTRDASTGTMGINPNSVPRLGAPNVFTAAMTVNTTGTIPLQLQSSGSKTTFYNTNTNSTALGTHDWDMSIGTDSAFMIWDDTSNAAVFRVLGDGTATVLRGGVQINGNAATKPACDATNGPNVRGTIWFVNGGAAADSLQTCMYSGTVYAWRTVTIP